jgi:hypothetical protein
MQQLIKVLTPLFLIIIYITFSSLYNEEIELVDGYPIWMKNADGFFSRQTSGLYFLGRHDSKKYFLSANDNGRIERISIDESFNPPVFNVVKLINKLSTVNEYLRHLGKWDYEDIVYDKVTNKILVSMEGTSGLNDLTPREFVNFKQLEGIYEIAFNKTIFDCDTLTELRKLTVPEPIFQHSNENVAIEGFAMTENYYFMGLENLSDSLGQFSDSTYLYVIDRKTNYVKTISSKPLNVRSISALCAVNDYTLYGVDRDSKLIFVIKFNKDFTVYDVNSISYELTLPLHEDISLDRMAGVEAIALDDEGNIYTDIDPWSDLYTPNFTPKVFLNEEEKSNIINLIPVLYKYKNPF